MTRRKRKTEKNGIDKIARKMGWDRLITVTCETGGDGPGSRDKMETEYSNVYYILLPNNI